VADPWTPRPGSGAPGEWRDAARRTEGGESAPEWHAPRLDPVEEWASEIRTDAATQRRRRENWLRRQAADDASLVGVLVDLAEQGHLVRIATVGGGSHQGRLRGAGSQVLVLECGRTRVLVAVDAVTTVQAVPGDDDVISPVGHRVDDDPTTLSDLLSHSVDDGVEVTLVTRGGQVVSGEVASVGRDVVLVRPDRRTPLVYVVLDSLSEAVLPLSTRSG